MKPLATLRPDWRNLFKDVPNKVEMIETIFEQTAYKTAEVFRQQVRSLHYNSLYVAIATGDARYRLTQEEIASMYETVNFDQVHHQLTAIYAENRDEKRSCGRPLAIGENDLTELFDYCLSDTTEPKKYTQIVTFITNKLGYVPDHKTVELYLEKLGLDTIFAKPIEAQRYKLDINLVIQFIRQVAEFFNTQSINSRFVYNLDEEGHSERVDSKIVRVVVRKGTTDTQINYPINKVEKRATFLACINGCGEYIKPVYIDCRKTTPVKLIQENMAGKMIIKYSPTRKSSTNTEFSANAAKSSANETTNRPQAPISSPDAA